MSPGFVVDADFHVKSFWLGTIEKCPFILTGSPDKGSREYGGVSNLADMYTLDHYPWS